jgi:hypothetical protein
MFFSRPSRYLRLLRGAPSGSQRYFVNQAGIVVDDHPRRPIHSAPIPITITSATLARVARIDALVSGDTHLLALRDRLPVMSPREFLDSLANR